MTQNVRELVAAVVGWIESDRDQFDAALSAVLPGMRLGAVLGYWTQNLDVSAFPAILVDMSGETMGWEGLPDIGETVMTLQIYGLVHVDEPAARAEVLGTLAAMLKWCLNRRHRRARIGDIEITVRDEQPLRSISYGTVNAGQVLEGFSGTYQAVVTHVVIDDRPEETL